MKAQIVYSNDLLVERQRQENAAGGPEGPEARRATLTNRIARAGRRKKLIMLAVAEERSDKDVAAEIRTDLKLASGEKVSDLIVVKQSRRTSVSKEMVALGGVSQAERDAVLQGEKDARDAAEDGAEASDAAAVTA